MITAPPAYVATRSYHDLLVLNANNNYDMMKLPGTARIADEAQYSNSRPTLLYCTIRALTVRTASKLPPVTAKDGSPLASSDQLYRWKDPLASSWNLQHNSRASEIWWSPHYQLDGPSFHYRMEIMCHPH